jgi:hypothetical protein
MNWHELAIDSHYQTAVAIKDALQAGEVPEAIIGIEELIEALSRSDKRALASHLVNLMTHILKWQAQPAWRSRSWALTMRQARRAIARLQRETPSLTRTVMEAMWEDCLQDAPDEAEKQTHLLLDNLSLTWEQVCEASYELEESAGNSSK